jgi:hypothetical protein
MPRIVRKLTVLEVAAAAKEPGLHAVGDNLYLQVKNGSASWAYRFMIAGKARCMGLGSFRKTNLAKARQRAQECHDLLAAGKDPIDARHAVRTATAVAAAQAISFEQCADEYIKAKHAGWGAKHAAQWKKTLETFTFPIIGKLPVKEIDTVLVVKVLEPIWQTKTETAKRLRSRIESVLDWAKARGHRAGENPARWRGHLETQLVKPGDIKIEQHHAAMPYAAVPAFVATLRSQGGTAARALEFAILTAARSGEIFGATWREID